jgi:phosphatidylglycerophosphate synthase
VFPLPRDRVLTIPNLLSLSRLALLPVWWWLAASPDPTRRTWAGALIAYGIVSDVADGYLARHLNQASEWGRLFDPVGDKIAGVVVGLFCVIERGMPWEALGLVVLRDLGLIIGGALVYRRTGEVPRSADIGRYAALLWAVVLLLYIFTIQPVGSHALWPAVAFYFVAGALYVRRLR